MTKAKNTVAKLPPETTVERIEVRAETIAASLPRADADRFKEAWAHYENAPKPPSFELENAEGRQWAVKHPGTDADKTVGHLRRLLALGSKSQAFVDTLLAQLMTLWEKDGGITSSRYNAALAVLESQKPENELQAMLVVQMIAANDAALRCTSMYYRADFVDTAATAANLSNKYMRTFVAQAECLSKLQRGGEQVVKYVHVHEGGQAVVAGTINQTGGRANLENTGQPCGAGVLQDFPALPGQNPAGDGVPVTGNAEREMSHSRREKPWGAQGQQERLEARDAIG